MSISNLLTPNNYDLFCRSINSSGETGISLEELSDVQITNHQSGQMLQYNGTEWVNGVIVQSGTYNPIVTPGVNMGSPVVNAGKYTRIGNLVNVVISFAYNASATGTLSTCNITLPVAKSGNFNNVYDATGMGSQVDNNNGFTGIQVRAANGGTVVNLFLSPVASNGAPIQADITFTYLL